MTAFLGSAAAGSPGLHARAANAVRVGTLLSVSGPAAFLGEDVKDGAQLAVDEINNSGGIGLSEKQPVEAPQSVRLIRKLRWIWRIKRQNPGEPHT